MHCKAAFVTIMVAGAWALEVDTLEGGWLWGGSAVQEEGMGVVVVVGFIRLVAWK
jgi:hypothetical protein